MRPLLALGIAVAPFVVWMVAVCVWVGGGW